MAKHYAVKLKAAPKGHELPALLKDFGAWLVQQPYGGVGWFELDAQAVPGPFGDADHTLLTKNAWCFGWLPDGSMLALITGIKPAPVVLFGSEGELVTVATSLEAFVQALATGRTGVSDLDEDEGQSKRAELAEWLTARKLKVPSAKPFKLKPYLEALQPPKVADSPAVKKLPPNIRQLVSVLGQNATEAATRKTITSLGLKVPAKPKPNATIVDKKAGIALTLDKALAVSAVVLTRPYAKPLPFKAQFEGNLFSLKKVLGKPTSQDKGPKLTTRWDKTLDAERGIQFSCWHDYTDSYRAVRLFVKPTTPSRS